MKSAENTEITFSNWIWTGNQKKNLNELSKESQELIANNLIYRPLTMIPNVEITQTA